MIKPVEQSKRAKRARAAWLEIRRLAETEPSPFQGMTKSQVLAKLRKSREKLFNAKLWNKKLEAYRRSRCQ